MARPTNRSRNAVSYREDDDDEIEQTQPTQKRARISVPGGSSSQGGRGNSTAGVSSSSPRKGKGRASNQGQDEGDGDNDEDDDADEGVELLSVEEIKERVRSTPLNPRIARGKMNMHANEYEAALGKCDHVLEYLGDAAIAVEELFEEGETDLINELDSSVREVIDGKAEMAIRQQVLRSMISQLDQQKDVINPVTLYEETVKRALQRHKAKTTRKKYAKDPSYVKFRSIIWEVHNAGTAMPSLTDYIEAEPGDEAEDEVEDFEAGGVAQNFKCPLTTAILEDPVTSRQAIEDYIAGKNRERRPALCPQSGCNVVLTLGALKTDTNLAKRVAIYQRRLQSQATQATQHGSASGAAGRSGGAGAARKAKLEGVQEDAIEEIEEGSDEEEEIEID
ncbi:hypothetical protein OC846_000041 [Tilletia horrida]|uniref:SP-RING-type domain-containing protein n=1 Tax=Tilletia horrida TaxID=155126 RepID=A0AAN6GYX1_9BASI|nr:hypothetical protein OC846_000041 [Tilletia horrida]KAK0569186.1 hypothetical protein OC861_001222 [Tilletia horrida]